jgi:hypothetical protein
MGLILAGVFLVIVGFLVNVLDLLPGTIMRTVGWILIIVGVALAFLDILRDAARARPGAVGTALRTDDTKITFIVWGIGLIVFGLLVDIFTSASGGILRTLGWLLIIAGIILAFIDIAREPRHRTLRYRA